MAINITGFEDDQPPLLGIFDSGATTDDSSPKVQGTISVPLDAGESVVVLRNDATLGTASVAAGGSTWSYQDSGLLNGTYIYTAQVVDAAGAPTANSGALTITVAANPPQIVTIMAVQDNLPPVIGLITDGSTTNDDTPTFQGTLSAALSSGQSLHIFRNSVDVGTARVSGTNWVFEDGGLQSGKTYTYTARVVDRQGNMGSESEPISFTLDTAVQGGVEIEHIVDKVLPIVGDIPNNGYTNDTSPQLTGSLLTRLGAGQKVEVLRDGEVVGTATLTSNTTWSYQDSGLASKTSPYTYTARVVNADGQEIAGSSAWKITVDTSIPTAKPVITSFVDDQLAQTGEFHSGDSTNDLTPLLQGTVEGTLGPREVVGIYRGGIKIGSVPVHEDGSWSFQDGGLRDGQTYTYTARVEDAAGNQGQASNTFTILTDATPPTATAPIGAITDDTGAPGDFITGDPTLVISGTLSGTLGAGEKVQISLDGGITWNLADTSGTGWSWDNTANTLPDGEYTIQTRVIDLAGNTGRTASQALTIDATPPDAPRIDEVIDNRIHTYTGLRPVTGPIGDGSFTDDLTPTFHGSGAEAGNIVKLYDESGKLLASTTADANGDWICTPVLGAQDDHSMAPHDIIFATKTFTATSVDALGNESDPSAGVTFIVDNAPPSLGTRITQAIDDAGPVQGVVPNSNTVSANIYIGSTDDTTPLIMGYVFGGGAVEKPTPLRAEHDDIVVVYRNYEAVGSATVDENGYWTYQETTPLTSGQFYSYYARVMNGASVGDGQSNPCNIRIDTTAPTQTVGITYIMDDRAPASSYIRSGGTTSDLTPRLLGAVDGTLAPDEYVAIYRDGVLIGSVTTDDNSSMWHYHDSLAPGNTYTYTAKVIDAAGNQGPAPASSFTLYTEGPAVDLPMTQPAKEINANTGMQYIDHYYGWRPFTTNVDGVYYAGDGGGWAPLVNGVDLIRTGSGNSWVHGIGADTTGRPGDLSVQHDQVTCYGGYDHVGIIGTNFTSIEGGLRWDTLAFEGSNITLDLTAMAGRVHGFEQFDLNNQLNRANSTASDPRGQFTTLTHGNTLKLSLADVLSQPDTLSKKYGGLSDGSDNHLSIRGDDSSTVNFTDSGWAKSGELSTTTIGDGTLVWTNFDVWHNAAQGASTAGDLLIQQGVHVI